MGRNHTLIVDGAFFLLFFFPFGLDQELNFYWANGIPLPRMVFSSTKQEERSANDVTFHEEKSIDFQYCLIYQKLQMLDLCVTAHVRETKRRPKMSELSQAESLRGSDDDAEDDEKDHDDNDYDSSSMKEQASSGDGWDEMSDLELEEEQEQEQEASFCVLLLVYFCAKHCFLVNIVSSFVLCPPTPIIHLWPTQQQQDQAPKGVSCILEGTFLLHHPSVPLRAPHTQPHPPMTEDMLHEQQHILEVRIGWYA